MKIHEKLDLLMKITNSKNTELAQKTSFDPSYISRIRTGKRSLPSESSAFLKTTASVIAVNADTGQRRNLLKGIVGENREWPDDISQIEEYIYDWLVKDLNNINGDNSILINPNFAVEKRLPIDSSKLAYYFYGIEGKRKAAVHFMNKIIETGEPHTIYFYSGSDVSWIHDDETFVHKLFDFAYRLKENGGNIISIHSLNFDLNEMMSMTNTIIPLCLSTNIETYFYPKLLDSTYRRTLLVAKGHSSIESSYLATHSENAFTTYIMDEKAVEALEYEFETLLKSCKPLVRIFSNDEKEDLWENLYDFQQVGEDFIIMQPYLSSFTMPLDVAKSISRRYENDMFLWFHQNFLKCMKENLESGYKYTEIIKLSNANVVRQGLADLPFVQYKMYYTAEEYEAHIRNIIALLRKYENYNLLIVDDLPVRASIYAKEFTGFILADAEDTTKYFVVNETRMTLSLWEYFNKYVSMVSMSNKERIIDILLQHIDKIKK